MSEQEYKDAFEGMMKGILEDTHPVLKIDYNMEKMFPSGTLEIHDCPPDIVGMMFMEVFAAINEHIKTEESRKRFKECLKLAVDLYDKPDEKVGDL